MVPAHHYVEIVIILQIFKLTFQKYNYTLGIKNNQKVNIMNNIYIVGILIVLNTIAWAYTDIVLIKRSHMFSIPVIITFINLLLFIITSLNI